MVKGSLRSWRSLGSLRTILDSKSWELPGVLYLRCFIVVHCCIHDATSWWNLSEQCFGQPGYLMPIGRSFGDDQSGAVQQNIQTSCRTIKARPAKKRFGLIGQWGLSGSNRRLTHRQVVIVNQPSTTSPLSTRPSSSKRRPFSSGNLSMVEPLTITSSNGYHSGYL